MQKINQQINNLNLFQKRIEILIGAKLRENNKIERAISIQDKIRSKIKSWNGAAEIKKWREKRIAT